MQSIFEVNAAKAMYIKKELKCYQGSDSANNSLLIHTEIEGAACGGQGFGCLDFQAQGSRLGNISCIAIFLFEPSLAVWYQIHWHASLQYNEENFPHSTNSFLDFK